MNKPGVSAKLKEVLKQVSAYDNVPRKKAKFEVCNPGKSTGCSHQCRKSSDVFPVLLFNLADDRIFVCQYVFGACMHKLMTVSLRRTGLKTV